MKKSSQAIQGGAVDILESESKTQVGSDKNMLGALKTTASMVRPSVAQGAQGFRYFSRDKILNCEGKIVSLSEREFQILGELNTESQSKAIAFNLNISINTLNQHLRSIYHKLGTHSRMGAVIIANKNKLYDSQP